MAKDYYGILGVEKNASADEIKSAYRRMAKKYHPDVFATAGEKEKADAEAKFKDVQHAYAVLSDPQKKAAYDQYGSEDGPTFNGGAGGAGFNPFGGAGFGDIFSDIFSAFNGGGGRSSNSPREGDDIEIEVNLTFREACFGAKKDINYSRVEKCSTCNGSGAKNGTSVKTCSKCGGRGRVVVQQRTMLGVMQTERACDMCGGTGKIIMEPCPDCKGKGKIRKQCTKTINIPAGVDNGQMLNVPGGGHAGHNGGGYGNLIVVFRVKPHNLFVRNKNDLHLELPITITQAVFGDEVEIPTMDKPIRIDIPAGTKNGTVLKVKGKGVKDLRRNAYGDLMVTIKVDVPKNISNKIKKDARSYFEDIDKNGQYDEIDKYKKKLRNID